MKRKDILDMLSDRHKHNRDRIRCLKSGKNEYGQTVKVPKTALSVCRKEQLIVELLMELSAQCPDTVKLSERGVTGLLKLTEPLVYKKSE